MHILQDLNLKWRHFLLCMGFSQAISGVVRYIYSDNLSRSQVLKCLISDLMSSTVSSREALLVFRGSCRMEYGT